MLLLLFVLWVACLIDPRYLNSESVYFMAPVVSNIPYLEYFDKKKYNNISKSSI